MKNKFLFILSRLLSWARELIIHPQLQFYTRQYPPHSSPNIFPPPPYLGNITSDRGLDLTYLSCLGRGRKVQKVGLFFHQPHLLKHLPPFPCFWPSSFLQNLYRIHGSELAILQTKILPFIYHFFVELDKIFLLSNRANRNSNNSYASSNQYLSPI